MSRRISVCLFLFACVMAAGIFGQTAQAGTYRIIYANYFGPSHPNSLAMEIFKQRVEKESNGQIKVVVKPNNEAGGEEKIMELVKRGALQIVQVGGLLKDDEPMIGSWEQPFMINSWAHAKKVFFDPGWMKFAGKYTEKTGVLIKGLVVNGFREISSNFLINKMDDFKRMKIRTPLADTYVKLFVGLGTNPTPMPMTELYTALETKVVDGQDNPYSTVKNMGWWEVQPYMLESRHVFSPTSVLVNGKFYNSLPEDLKKIFDAAMQESIDYAWDRAEEDENECIEFLKSKNITITIPDDNFKQGMRDAMKPVYEWYDSSVPGAKEVREFCAERR